MPHIPYRIKQLSSRVRQLLKPNPSHPNDDVVKNCPENMQFACFLNDIPVNGLSVSVNNYEIGLFNVGAQVFAIENTCSHKDAELTLGDIEDLEACFGGESGGPVTKGGLCIQCPKHKKPFHGGLYFSLETGHSFTKAPAAKWKPTYQQATFDVEIIDDSVYVCKTPRKGTDGYVAEAKYSAPAAWFQFQLQGSTQVSPDSFIFCYQIDAPIPALTTITSACEANMLWHVSLRAELEVEGRLRTVERDYTPVSSLSELAQGSLRLLVKVCSVGLFCACKGTQVCSHSR
jgi:nitrite reductase/ring-hydroxylating ferredoxin subunit